jgi:hypothetical protein
MLCFALLGLRLGLTATVKVCRLDSLFSSQPEARVRERVLEKER